ncbi:11228_t:CDS:1, partial [Dentiscutata heterogama]
NAEASISDVSHAVNAEADTLCDNVVDNEASTSHENTINKEPSNT